MIDGSIAFITGGASGIGYVIANQLLKSGAKKVIIADINTKLGEESAKKLQKIYSEDRVKFVALDVTNTKKFEEIFKQLSQDNEVDLFFNNAGIATNDDEQVIKTNLIAANEALKLCFKYMKKGGTVVNTASISAFSGESRLPGYAASKHGVLGLTLSYSKKEYFEKVGINVIAICPGLTLTPIVTRAIENQIISKEDIEKLFVPQSPESLAANIPFVLDNSQNGAIWILEAGEAYEVEIPGYTSFQRVEKK